MKTLIASIIVLSSLLGGTKILAQVAVGVSVDIAPPAIPVYEQPLCPVEGYWWTPGYWGWGADGYYWVPGVWVAPARSGWFWTPGYWGWEGGHYWWHGGYWGPHVGFYGGINYGYGYGGAGFYGGRWEGGSFRYNTAVWHTGPGFHNTYADRTVIVNNNNHTSFNDPRGVSAQPTASEQSAMREQHVQATSQQQSNEHSASTNRNQLASVNKGHPAATAMNRVGGQSYNSAGHSVSAGHATGPTNANHAANPSSTNHAAPTNANHAAPANVNHAAPSGASHVAQPANRNHGTQPNAPRQQTQHRANPNRSGARGGRGGGGERGRR